MKRGLPFFVLAAAAGFAFAGCFFPGGCPDVDEYVYDLRDGDYLSSPSSSTLPARLGAYPTDDQVTLRVDAAAEEMVASFESEGRAVELRYAVTSVDPPRY